MNKDDVKVLIKLTSIVLITDILFLLAIIGIWILAPASTFKLVFGLIYTIITPLIMIVPNRTVIGGWQNYFKDKKDA